MTTRTDPRDGFTDRTDRPASTEGRVEPTRRDDADASPDDRGTPTLVAGERLTAADLRRRLAGDAPADDHTDDAADADLIHEDADRAADLDEDRTAGFSRFF